MTELLLLVLHAAPILSLVLTEARSLRSGASVSVGHAAHLTGFAWGMVVFCVHKAWNRAWQHGRWAGRGQGRGVELACAEGPGPPLTLALATDGDLEAEETLRHGDERCARRETKVATAIHLVMAAWSRRGHLRASPSTIQRDGAQSHSNLTTRSI